MHVITGGSYNGKSAWVKEYYQLNDSKQYAWLSAYKEEQFLPNLSSIHKDIVILEGIEQWIFNLVTKESTMDYRVELRKCIETWIEWEQENKKRKLIIIGVDISKGIVPVDPKIRFWRDITGWFYQDLIERSQRFDLVWYGIHKRLK